jgi:hypothetical protein
MAVTLRLAAPMPRLMTMTNANKFMSQARLTFAAPPAGSEMKDRDSDYQISFSIEEARVSDQ